MKLEPLARKIQARLRCKARPFLQRLQQWVRDRQVRMQRLLPFRGSLPDTSDVYTAGVGVTALGDNWEWRRESNPHLSRVIFWVRAYTQISIRVPRGSIQLSYATEPP